MLEAMATEAGGEEEAVDPRRPADDGVLVGRQWAKTGPASADPRLVDDRQPMQSLFDRLAHARPVQWRRQIVADVLDVGGREQELLHLLPEIEAARAVGGERNRAGDLGERLGEEDVAAARQHR